MNVFLVCVCACATGLSLGIGIKHHQDLKKLSDAAQTVSYSATATQEDHTDPSVTGKGGEANNIVLPKSAAQYPIETGMNKQVYASNLVGQLQQIEAQQSAMMRQQAELNRELNAIQFRLDTHSSSFRPLRANSTQSGSSNNDFNFEDNPLLPPLSQ